jgi:hypothetical protein
VTTPDFEIDVGLHARNLVSHVPPEARTETEGDDMRLARRQARTGLPEETQAGGHYSDVVVEKRVVGFNDVLGGNVDEEVGTTSQDAARRQRASPKRRR